MSFQENIKRTPEDALAFLILDRWISHPELTWIGRPYNPKYSLIDGILLSPLSLSLSLRALVAVTLYWFPSLYLGKISWKKSKNLPQQMPYI
jgi:hypothetical protein